MARTEALQMAAAVRKNGSPVWYLEAKYEGHGFGKKAIWIFCSTPRGSL